MLVLVSNSALVGSGCALCFLPVLAQIYIIQYATVPE